MKRFGRFPALLALGALVASLPACDEARLYSWTRHFDLFFPEGGERSDTFTQEAAARVDILFVIDNSESMVEEQNNIANNFQAFMRFISESEVDFQIGVISTDMDLPEHQGKLLGNPRIITGGAGAEAQFSENIKVGTAGAGNEKGLYAAYTALSEPLISGHNSGFMRDDAALVVIFVSDEDDNSTGQVAFYHRTLAQLKGVGNERRVIVGSLVGDAPDGCQNASTGSARPGDRYLELTDLMEGVSGSICAQNFGETLSQLGVTAAGLARKFVLSDNQPEEGTIEVWVDQPVGGLTQVPEDPDTGWIFENGAIYFAGYWVPMAGSTITVHYQHPQREFILTREPKYDENSPGQGIAVKVYPEGSAECSEAADCSGDEDCGLSGICGGEVVPYSFSEGWILKTKVFNDQKMYVVAFERDNVPVGGDTVEVSYQCQGGCRVQP